MAETAINIVDALRGQQEQLSGSATLARISELGDCVMEQTL